MLIKEPKTFKNAIAPMSYFNLAIGANLLWEPCSPFVRLITALYSVSFSIFYLIIIYIGVTTTVLHLFDDTSPMAGIMYRALGYTNAVVALTVPIVSWRRRQGVGNAINRIGELNDSLATLLGIKKDYRKVIITQIYYVTLISLFLVIITIVDGVWLRKNGTLLTDFIITTVFHHPILLMLAADFTFCAFVRYLTKKFLALNNVLIGLNESRDGLLHNNNKTIFVTERTVRISPLNNEIGKSNSNNSNNESHLLQTIRKIHLELSKEAAELNLIFGLQNLISMGVSFVMVTGLLYTIYSASSWKHESHNVLEEILPCSCWCFIYAFKIFFLSHSCARISEESERSGQILYEIVGSVIDKDFDKEVQQFALQMIQNPVQFTACGFFILDHTYIQGVIGSITTYLVILIQMSNVSPSTSDAVTGNKTRT